MKRECDTCIKNIMSEEAFNELIDGFEYMGNLTDYGRENIKYHVQKLQQENKQLKDNWNKLKKQEIDRFNESQDVQFLDVLQDMQELEQGSDSNGSKR